MINVKINLNDTLNRLNLSPNQVAVQARIRPASVSDMASGKAKSVMLKNVKAIATAIYDLTGERIAITDIIDIDYKQSE